MFQERLLSNRWFSTTVQQFFVETCAYRPEKTAIYFEGKEISYRDLQENVNRFSQVLLRLGVKRGDRVAMLPASRPEFVYAYFAVLQIGAVLNPLNLLWGAIEFEGILQRNDPKVIISTDTNAGRDYIQLLRDVIPDLKYDKETVSSMRIPSLTHLISFSREGKRYEGFLDFSELLESGRGYDRSEISRLVREGKSTDIQFICQTSGTTGLAKSGLWNHRPPTSSFHFLAKYLTMTPDDTYINISPLYHNVGMVFGLFMNLAYLGSTLYLLDGFDAVEAMELMDKFNITASAGFDAHFQALKKAFDAGKYKFTLNKIMAAIQPSAYDMLVKEMCRSEDVQVLTLFGQTENGPLVALVEPDCMDYRLRKFSNGRPLPGVEMVIKDVETGKTLMSHEQGEICYKSPYMFSGYYKQEKETAELFDEEGYFHSGDYGTFKGGYLYYYGRLGGIVKTGGENVSLTYVNQNLLKLFPDEFDDVQTIGIPDPHWGWKLVSYIRMNPGKKLRDIKEYKVECKGKMAEYEIPKQIFEWEGQWPITSVGKTDLIKLKAEMEKRLGVKT
ncbi:MAG: class I adenylate-forming enzyme family protein [Chloroflexi bacterium]|nr:class I adenylate-forming enzyme family protein [Chloroflexota bacterium]